MLEAVEIVYTGIRVGNTRYRAEPQERFTSEVIRREHVVIHHGEQNHGVWTSTLLHAHGANDREVRRESMA